jgi:class 3 adenylate cyclase
MAEFPSGTVTFLFSDVEGSTRLLTRLRGSYAWVLGEYRRLLRAAFDEHDGREVDTDGDGFFVVFARASDAIAAAISAQRSLASRGWPEGVEVRVRIGVHTGEAELGLDDYVGLDVHRAARICAAGHGGQVLISSSTRELVADELPADVALRDLGEHRLKDLDGPDHVFQIVASDLPVDFPPLGAGAATLEEAGGAGALPPSPNATIGVRMMSGTSRSGCASTPARGCSPSPVRAGSARRAWAWRPPERSGHDLAMARGLCRWPPCLGRTTYLPRSFGRWRSCRSRAKPAVDQDDWRARSVLLNTERDTIDLDGPAVCR